jgi:hypothetical protein
MEKENIVIKKKLSHNIERINLREFTCDYRYNFSTKQWLESIDNYDFFGIEHNDVKQKVLDSLVDEFRLALNNVIFGDPAGRSYVEHINKTKINDTNNK